MRSEKQNSGVRGQNSESRRLLSVSFRVVCFVMLAVSFCLVDSASAQQPSNPTVQEGVLGQMGFYAIRNARIVTVSGPEIENGTVVIRNGKIEAVGSNVTVPSGAEVIDGRGLVVYPGMIDVGTSLGLIEIPSGAPGTVDSSEIGEMNPNAQALVAINPHSAHIAVTRVNGVTTVLTMPTGGIISGQAAIINLNGTTPREMAVVAQAALVINFPRATSRGAEFIAEQQQVTNLTQAIEAAGRQVEQLRKLLRDAEAYGRAQDAYAHDKNLPRPSQDVVLASLVPFVRGERPVVIRADRESEIRAAVRFAEEMRLKPIILGGDDAWKVASFLKEHNVPVIVTGTLDLPLREDDYYDTLYTNAARLQQAGVRFCISSGFTNSETNSQLRNLPFQPGTAAAFGLPKDAALKAFRLYPT